MIVGVNSRSTIPVEKLESETATTLNVAKSTIRCNHISSSPTIPRTPALQKYVPEFNMHVMSVLADRLQLAYERIQN